MWLQVLLLLFIAVVLFTQPVETASGCTLKTKKGTIDLSPLAKRDYYTPESPYLAFFVNICKNAAKSCDGVDYPAIYFFKDSMDRCNSYLGKLSSTQITLKDTNNPEAGAILEYWDGKLVTNYQKRTRIILTCDRSVKTPVDSLQMTYLDQRQEGTFDYYVFGLTTAYACPGSKSVGRRRVVGVGGAFLIIIPILLTLYMIIGSLILKFKFQKTGVEMIIHYQYIIQIPFLIWEGVLFLFEGVKSLVAKVQGKGNYQEVA